MINQNSETETQLIASLQAINQRLTHIPQIFKPIELPIKLE